MALAHCYGEESSTAFPDIFEPAQTAFEQAREEFPQRSSKDPKKRSLILQGTSMYDVLNAVITVEKRYQDDHTGSKTRQCLTGLSKRICYYGNVMDVLVQHHPEYVSLAWGAMKFVFGAIVEHENLGRTIIAGLCDIADALPRVELTIFLYPTNAMKQAVCVLYAHIIKFLVRASKWYEEGKLARAFHSITKPAALRYDDLIGEIQRATRSIADLAITSGQAEQRDVHNEVRALTILVKQLREEMLLDQSIRASTFLDCQRTLSDVQLMQALALISSACTVDYKSDFQTALLVRDKHPLASNRSKHIPLWIPSEVHAWNNNQISSVIAIRSNFRDRLHLGNFSTDVIEQLRSANIIVLWVLKSRQKTQYSVHEVLKSLIHQALSCDPASYTDSGFSFQLRKFLDAKLEEEYLTLLGSILEQFKLVHIIVEAGAMESANAHQCEFYLRDLLQRLSEKGAAAVVKIMTLSCGPQTRLRKSKDSVVLRFGPNPHQISERQTTARNSRPRMHKGVISPVLPFHKKACGKSPERLVRTFQHAIDR